MKTMAERTYRKKLEECTKKELVDMLMRCWEVVQDNEDDGDEECSDENVSRKSRKRKKIEKG